jgi:hypothetical protein
LLLKIGKKGVAGKDWLVAILEALDKFSATLYIESVLFHY